MIELYQGGSYNSQSIFCQRGVKKSVFNNIRGHRLLCIRLTAILFALPFIISIWLSSTVYADIAAIKQRGYIRIALPKNNIYGYVMQKNTDNHQLLTNNNDLVGIDILVANMIARALDVKIHYIRQKKNNYNRLVNLAENGTADIAMGDLSITWQRAQHVNFTRPYLRIPLILVTRSVLNTKYIRNNVQALNKPSIRLGVISHSIFFDFTEYLLPKARLKVYKTRAALITALQKNQVDTIIIDNDILSEFYKKYPSDILTYSSIPLKHFTDPIGIAVSYKNPRLHSWLNLVLKTLNNTTIMDSYYKQYFPETSLN